MSTTHLASASAPASTVSVAAIERELEALFRPSAENPGESLTRACMSNLLVYCDTRATSAAVAGEIPDLVFHHPARILLLVSRDEAGAVDAQVAAQCYLGSGGRHVCAEHVTLSATPKDVRLLPSLARSLLVGDLPTALWWAAGEPPADALGMFGELADLAQRIILDSARLVNVERSIVRARVLAESDERAFFDLTWDRLTPWRRSLSEAFNPRAVGDALERLSSVAIEHTASGRAAAWLMAGWLASRLGWTAGSAARDPDGAIAVVWRRGSGKITTKLREAQGRDEIVRLRLSWATGKKEESAEISRLDGARVGAASGPETMRASAPMVTMSRAAAVASHLPVRPDAILQAAWCSAATAAEMLG